MYHNKKYNSSLLHNRIKHSGIMLSSELEDLQNGLGECNQSLHFSPTRTYYSKPTLSTKIGEIWVSTLNMY